MTKKEHKLSKTSRQSSNPNLVFFVQLFTYLLLHIPLKLLFGTRVKTKTSSVSKPIIVASNHTSKIDVFLLATLPFGIALSLMPLYSYTTVKYYNRWYLKPFLQLLGCYPAPSSGWTFDEYLSTSIEKLQQNHAIIFFPEGRIIRTGDTKEAKPGIGYLVDKTDAQILPMKISWKTKPYRKGLEITIGSPQSFDVSSTLQKKESAVHKYRTIAKLVMNRIYSL